jgi:hypothetical protein
VTTTQWIYKHALQRFTGGADIAKAIKSMEPKVFIALAIPTGQVDDIQRFLWTEAVKKFTRQKEAYDDHNNTLYSIILGQCTPYLITKIEADGEWPGIMEAMDGIKLLRSIKRICYNYQSQKNFRQSVHEALYRFYHLSMDKYTTPQEYFERFMNQVHVVEEVGGSFGSLAKQYADAFLQQDKTLAEMTEAEQMKILDTARDGALAMAFIMGVDRTRYSGLLIHLENQHTQGMDMWPKTPQEAYSLLSNWRANGKPATTHSKAVAFHTEGSGCDDSEAVALATQAKKRMKTGQDEEIKCFRCQ